MPHNKLVRLIYEATDDPQRWAPFLDQFADTIRADTAGLLTQDKAGDWARIGAAVGIDPESRKSYEEHFVSRNPWLQRRNICIGAVETEEQIVNLRELVKTDFYRDFLRPHSWFHGCSAITNVDVSSFSCFYALRAPRYGAFGRDEIELCRYLAPHIQTAARIQQRIADQELTLDRLRAGEMDPKTLSILGLTPAETRLAIALFKGQSVEAYAQEAGISSSTARWHVRQIYAKTGVKRQSELIQTLLKYHRRPALESKI